jgi:hypothetical protein
VPYKRPDVAKLDDKQLWKLSRQFWRETEVRLGALEASDDLRAAHWFLGECMEELRMRGVQTQLGLRSV